MPTGLLDRGLHSWLNTCVCDAATLNRYAAHHIEIRVDEYPELGHTAPASTASASP